MEKLLNITYEEIWSRRDTRVDGWPLMSSPIPTAVLCASYVFLVTVAGPRFMRHREPYNIKAFLIVYNFLQVLLSAYIFFEVMGLYALVEESDERKCIRGSFSS